MCVWGGVESGLKARGGGGGYFRKLVEGYASFVDF